MSIVEMTIVTISRQLGSGGNGKAAGVAEALGLKFIDREIMNRAAHEAGVPKIALQEMEYEGQRTLSDDVSHQGDPHRKFERPHLATVAVLLGQEWCLFRVQRALDSMSG
jgi:hypothetical protein